MQLDFFSNLLTTEDRGRVVVLLLLLLISALFEVLGIGLILPFIGLLSNPEWIHSNPNMQNIFQWLAFETDVQFIILLGCMIIFLFLIKSVFSIVLSWYQASFYLGKQKEIQGRLFKNYMSAPYIFHIHHNSAHLIRNISAEAASVCHGVLLPMFTMIAEGVVVLFVVVLLAYLNPVLVGSALLLALLLFGWMTAWLRPQLTKCGEERVYFGGQMIKEINQGLGGIKAIKLSQSIHFSCAMFSESVTEYTNATKRFSVLSAIPRPIIEAFAATLIIMGIIIALIKGVDTGLIISTVTVFAVAFIRLMPSASKIIAAMNILAFNQKSLAVINQELRIVSDISMDDGGEESDSKHIDVEEFHFRSLEFQCVSYAYPNSEKFAIKDVSFTFPAGTSAAFVGESGAGKSTLIDLALGLLQCDQGTILVDGINIENCIAGWRSIIGYVPQSIFILDDTVRRNVAFGMGDHEIEDALVWEVLGRASLDMKVRSLPDGLDTCLGERGARLSGGEIQRIGIARALYRKPKLLVFDEATSALDNQTERAVTDTINNLMGDITIMIIAHRLSTVRKCDKICFMHDGQIEASGSYAELLAHNDAFERFVSSTG